MRHLGIVLLLLLAAAGQARAECKVRHADVPVTMMGMSAMVPASLNGKSVRLQLDSGSFASILDEEAAKSLGLELHATLTTLQGYGGRVTAQLTFAKQFSLAGVVAPRNTPFLVIPISHGNGAAGLLGEDVLSVYDVEYDLANGMVRLMQIHDCGDYLAYWAKDPSTVSVVPISPASWGRWHILGTVLVNGQPVRAMFDTGAAHSTIDRAAAARAGVHPTDQGVTAVGVIGGAGSHLHEAWIGSFSEIQIGDEKIRNTQLLIGDRDRLAEAEMLVGADFFLSHRVLVARSKNRIYFTYAGGPVFRLDGPAPAAPQSTATDETNGPKDATGFQRRGSAKMARRDYEGALADLDQAVKLAPDDPSAWFHRGEAHWALRQAAPAIADLDAALKLRPTYAQAFLWRADIYRETGDRARSAADAAEAVRYAGDDWATLINAARLYGRIGEADKGVAVLDRLIQSNPGEIQAIDALAARCALRTRAGKDLDGALADCEAVLKRRGRNSLALEQRAEVRLRRGDTALALADFDAALKLQPKFAAALYGRGLARLRLGQSEGAQADLQAAKAIDPKAGKPFETS